MQRLIISRTISLIKTLRYPQNPISTIRIISTNSLHTSSIFCKDNMADESNTGQVTATPDDTIFGKIIRGEIKTEFLYKDDKCVAFKDINPVAPVHVLIVPVKPITQISEAQEEDEELLGHLLLVAKKVAEDQKLVKGYRLVINNGKEGQQSVYHLHIHLIGGKQLSWPPC